jgi:hypothetical protein
MENLRKIEEAVKLLWVIYSWQPIRVHIVFTLFSFLPGFFIDLFWDKCFCRFFWIVSLLADCSGANVYYMTPGCFYVGVESF